MRNTPKYIKPKIINIITSMNKLEMYLLNKSTRSLIIVITQ